MEQQPNQKRKKLIVLLIVLLIVIVLCAVGLVLNAMQQQRAAEAQKHIQEVAQPEIQSTPAPTQQVQQAEPTASKRPDIPIDFEALRQENMDIYAWIEIPGTQIKLPIVQNALDDAYYLTHNLAGQESPEGAIYTELLNSKDFSDPNTVIYGHNMKNGSMFAGLHQYEDKAFFEKNNQIVIYTPERKLTYRIFAAHEAGDEHLLHAYDFSNPAIFDQYIEDVKNMRDMRANIDLATEIKSGDKIITLSTCVKGQDHKRYFVQAVLETDE